MKLSALVKSIAIQMDVTQLNEHREQVMQLLQQQKRNPSEWFGCIECSKYVLQKFRLDKKEYDGSFGVWGKRK